MEQVKVILKLFVVMGVTWLSELCYFVVGWAVGREIVWKYFAINDFINFSQGTYWVTRRDFAQKTEKWAEGAGLASAADSVHSSVSCVTSRLEEEINKISRTFTYHFQSTC